MKRFLLVALLVACGSKSENQYGTWKKADTQAALQGAWLGPSVGNAINKAAIEITGDNVKVWDGKEEKTFKLKLDAPCKIGFEDAASKSGMTTYFGLVMKDGKAMWGAGHAGQRTGDTAIMCAGLTNWVAAKGGCKEESMGGGRWKDAKCGIRKKADGTEEAFWNWMDKEETAPMDGDYLWPSIKDDPATKHADFAAAKAALAEKQK